MNVKHHRPHILIVTALALVLMSGWHEPFRNALADLRFSLLQREAGGDVVVVAIDTPSIEQIGVWTWPASATLPLTSISARRPTRRPITTLSRRCAAQEAR